ncbi:MAG: hypothetical protein KJO07_18410 [Deltaproteobacteria bacterium]|nr:hypothetical protein [Deltaproteobacteria bacterium]
MSRVLLVAFLGLVVLGAGCIGCPAVAPDVSGTVVEGDRSRPLSSGESSVNRTPLEGATIELYSAGNLLDSWATDESGFYSVGVGDACEDYPDLELVVTAPGREPAVVDLQRLNLRVDVELGPQ